MEIVTGLFDDAPLYCESVLDFENARSDAVSQYYTELTRFLFAWGAFETVVDTVRPPGSGNGKVRAVGRFLGQRFEPDKLVHYGCVISSMRYFTAFQPDTLRITDSDFSPDGSYGESGIGLKVVYKLRNSLSHGSIEFPEPEDWGGRPKLDRLIARGSTRIVLYTIQMMLIAYFSASPPLVECRVRDEENGEEEREAKLDIRDLLKEIHLARPIEILG